MALYGAFSKYKHLSELADPCKIDGVIKTPAQRRALVRAAMGIDADDLTLTGAITLSGLLTANGGIALGNDALTRTGRQIIIPVGGNAQVGATSGWVITGTNEYSARLPASQTNATLAIPIHGLEVGDTLTALAVIGQVESAGNNVTCTLSVRKLTAAAADLTDAEIGTDNVGTLTADTLLDDATGALKVTGLTEVLAATESLYALLTGTTAASTDIAVQALVATVTRS